jgi:hypothetical protein
MKLTRAVFAALALLAIPAVAAAASEPLPMVRPELPSLTALPPQTPSHSVTLKWTPGTASPPATVAATSFNVYRFTGACATGIVFTLISPAGNGPTAPTYVDSTVTSGLTYCYQVTGVANGQESTASNEVAATIAAAPAAPTGLAITASQ